MNTFKNKLLLTLMSGQPYRYAKDVENFRQDYMESLGLRANLDDMNLQANKNYKETGALPPKSTMRDMRTTPEILADIEKLKLSLYAELKPVCSVQMAQLVVQRVQNSPLNADGSFLTWFAQNAPELVGQLKKKYKFGIVGNDNDVEQMLSFLSSIYSRSKDMGSTVKSAFDRPAGSDALGAQVGDFVRLKAQFDDIYLRLISSPGLVSIKNEVKQQLDALNTVLNNPANRYEAIKNNFNKISAGTSNVEQTIINANGFSDWVTYTDKIPAPSSLRALLDQLKKSEKNANIDLSIQILQNIKSILPTVSDSVKIFALTDKLLKIQASENPISLRPTPPPLPPLAGPAGPSITGQEYIPNPESKLNANETPLGGEAVESANLIVMIVLGSIYEDMLNLEDEPDDANYDFANRESQGRFFKQIYEHGLNEATELVNRQLTRAVRLYTQNNVGHVRDLINGQTEDQFIQSQRGPFISILRQAPDYSMKGFGITKRRGRPKGSGLVKPLSERIDHTKGIKQGHTHVPFGKYILNKNKLDSDLVYFKHTKGYGVKGFPMTKVSNKLGSVLRTIIGGGVPKFEDLNGLTESEKEYLHKVANKAGIMDKLSIPTPSKDKMEQDIHQFEVMKGELLSGNDSPELIKKFKLILLRLSRNGTIPKREATELMEDLIQLGY